MNRRFVLHAVLAAAAALFASAASADVLYKLIDKSGKVTYSEEKPKNFDGQVIRLDIDPNANTATMPKPASGANSGEPTPAGRRPADGAAKKPDAEERIAKARERLEGAQKALQAARDNPAEGDMEILGNKGGGVRMIPSADYQKKLDRLQQDVNSAGEELRRLESPS
jgi:Domain of unknown function (DUF4124)